MKVIIVGLGVQGNKRQKIAGSDVVAMVDPVHPNANYKDLSQVDPKTFDAALVCTPDETKYEILKTLLSLGKHVLVEKPLLFNSNDQIKELLNLANQNQVTCYTAYNHRFEPHFVKIKETLDSGVLGKLYRLRMFYGNGTARDVRNSVWRDKGMGVFSDIGSHLLDTINYWFDSTEFQFKPIGFYNFENKATDYVVFGTEGTGLSIQLEATMLSWRNTFNLDIYGELGSAHVNCLCKWGPSTFTLRKRVLPSGRPEETNEVLTCPDPTWELEYRHFLNLCNKKQSNIQNDLWINSTLNQVFKERAK